MEKSDDSKKAVKAGIGYTIGNVLVKGIAFLTLPIFSRLMTTDQFGVYNVFISYESILYVLIGLAMHCSVQSANLTFKSSINKYVSSISIIYIFNTIICFPIILIFGTSISHLIGFEVSDLYLLVIYSFSTAILTLYNYKLTLQYEYKKYLIISLISSLGNVILSLILMFSIYSSRRDLARIIGTTFVSFVIAVAIVISFYKKEKPRVNKEYWKFAYKYSLPLVPHGISQVLLAQFDRIMIRMLVSDSAAGIYSLATNVKLILTVITTSITSAWQTWFFNAMERGGENDIQKRSVQLLNLYSIFSIGLLAISPELIKILGGKEYEEAKYIAIPMIIDAFILFIYSIIVQSEYYTKKTKYIMIGTLIATAIDIITNYIFIKQYGYLAAAYTTLFAYIVYLILHLIISHKLIHFAIIPYKKLLIYTGVVVAFSVLCLIYINTTYIRWGICFVTVLIIGVRLLKDNGLKKLLNRE